MTVALVTGINGQHGSYLAELLLEKGYQVHGTVRDRSASKLSRIEYLLDKVALTEWDLAGDRSWTPLLEKIRPGEIYNLAARASSSTLFDQPTLTAKVNGLAVARLLEDIKTVDPTIRLCQASSREVFGNPLTAPQDESTTPRPRNPYGAAKQYADAMVRIYREQYGLFACSAVLFNHESPRRDPEFVTRKVSQAAARIKLGLAESLRLKSLSDVRDWGFAGDSVRAMWQMLQQREPDDFVVATGETHSVRELCEIAFSRVGLDYRKFVIEESEETGPKGAPMVGNPEKAKRVLGWAPTIDFRQLVELMVDADLQELK